MSTFVTRDTYNTQEEYFHDVIHNTSREKPIVHYYPQGAFIEVGCRATVKTVDHPAGYLNHAPYVHTSAVVEWDKETGVFVTRNTRYVPVSEV